MGHSQHPLHLPASVEYALMSVSVLVAIGGAALACLFYVLRPALPAKLSASLSSVYTLIYNKYYVDEIYNALFVRPTLALSTWLWRVVDVGIIDGAVNGSASVVAGNASLWRRLQSGNVQHYAVSMLAGAALLFAILVLG